MRTLLLFLALVASSSDVSAQITLRGELGRLGSLLGQWQGTGWVRYAPDGPVRQARVTAQGQPQLWGMRLAWTSSAVSTDRERAVVLSSDLGIRFRSDSSVFRADLEHFGARLDGWVRPGTCEMAWGYTVPQDPRMLFRYTSRVEGTRRVETGERSSDGGSTWWAFYGAEMTGPAVAGCPAAAPAAIP